MRLFAIIVILFSMLSCQSTDTAHSAYDHGVSNGREIMPVWPDNMPVWPDNRSVLLTKPLSQRLYVTLQDDEIARWKQIAAEAATSTAAWSRFGGARLIERPFIVDPTHIDYHGRGKDCVIRGRKLYIKNDANCGDIMLIVPTDQRSACASFFVEVIVARESGEVVGMKDSFWTDFPKVRRDKSCLTRRFDKPVRENSPVQTSKSRSLSCRYENESKSSSSGRGCVKT